MNSVAPVWDGNETWLVLGGGGLFAAFPARLCDNPAGALCAAHRHAAGAGLARRGLRIPLERPSAASSCGTGRSPAARRSARCCQGITLGALVQGITVDGRAYAGGWFDWLTPFSLVTGVALVVGYALLGATWLVMKTTDDLQRQAPASRFCDRRRYRGADRSSSACGRRSSIRCSCRPWFAFPANFTRFPVPLAVAVAAACCCFKARQRSEFPARSWRRRPVSCFLRRAWNHLYPEIMPPAITIWQAGARTRASPFS